MTQQKTSTTAVASERRGLVPGKALLGPLTVRDLAALVGVLVIFVASLLPLIMGPGFAGNLWNYSSLFFLGIGVILPLVVGALFAIRRLSPEVKLRVGSLSVDQFASVVAGFGTFYFFLLTVTGFRAAYLVGLIGALILLAATVLAQWIPSFAADFAGRAETPAHPVARDAVAATRRPAAPKPVLALPAGNTPGAGGTHAGQYGQPGQGQQGQPAQGQPVQGQIHGQGWNAGVQNPGHTAAGQIFTPAGEAAAAATGETGTASDLAASSASAIPGASGSESPATAASANDTAASATQSRGAEQTAGRGRADAITSAATPSAAGQSQADTTEPAGAHAANANSEPAHAGQGPVEGAVVVPSTGAGADSAPATMLNPKLVDAEPAPGESIGATVNPQAQAAAADPFWFAVDRPQNVVDEHTRQFVFKLMPGSWILALEDRSSSFLVQDSHGKTGLLLDLVGVERAPEGQ